MRTSTMQLRLKIFLLSIVPTAIAVGLVILAVQSQTLKLAKQERELMEVIYLASKEAELRAYVRLAKSAIEPLLNANDTDTPMRQAQAMAILSRMEFGQDGYFFVYDVAGNNLAHSRQPELVGQNLSDLKDPHGGSPIQALLEASRQGGGTVRYLWTKPSTGEVVSKLGYVEPITAWGWMLGTGLYLDDIEQTLQSMEDKTQTNFQDTQQHVYLIAAAAMVLIALAGLAVNVSDHRVSSAKLKHLAQRVVNSQEEERARVAQELHDGIIQVLVSAKFFIETAQLQHDQAGSTQPIKLGPAEALPLPGTTPLKRGLDRLSEALTEVRRISHDLRPALLDDFGLAPAIQLLVDETAEQVPFAICFETQGAPFALPSAQSTALYRISQESLTNARLHAHPSEVRVTLSFRKRLVQLTVFDDGVGFNVDRVQASQRGGIGLRNMRERMESLDGWLSISSRPSVTWVTASLPVASAAASVSGSPETPDTIERHA